MAADILSLERAATVDVAMAERFCGRRHVGKMGYESSAAASGRLGAVGVCKKLLASFLIPLRLLLALPYLPLPWGGASLPTLQLDCRLN